MARKTAAAKKVEPAGPRIVGDVVMHALDAVKPNDWNPNEFTPFQLASLKQGLVEDGWLKSQSLLVWRTDEKGKTKNLIIDGEHRHRVAKELGLTEGPMVFLDGVTEAYAKSLTVKLDAKRGKFNDADLGALLREIQYDLGTENLAVSIGVEDERLMKLLAEPLPPEPAVDPEPRGSGAMPGDVPSGMSSHVRMVQLFFSPEQHEEFTNLVKQLGAKYDLKTTTDVTLEAMRRAAAAKK